MGKKKRQIIFLRTFYSMFLKCMLVYLLFLSSRLQRVIEFIISLQIIRLFHPQRCHIYAYVNLGKSKSFETNFISQGMSRNIFSLILEEHIEVHVEEHLEDHVANLFEDYVESQV